MSVFTIESIVFHSSSGAIQHGARSQNMTYFRLQFLIGPSITMLYPVLVKISVSRELLYFKYLGFEIQLKPE